MKIVIKGPYNGKKAGTALALGFFDGLHIGHASVIKEAVACAAKNDYDPGVFTFTFDEQFRTKGKEILSAGEKHETLEDMGIKYCFEPPFSSFRNLSPEEFFYERLLGEYKAKSLFCGTNFAFGAKRAGNIPLLEKLCKENGVKLVVVPLTFWKGERVSSTRIREALANGMMEDVNILLGRPYEIDLPVQHGRKLGSTLGFPTINQHLPSSMQAPRQGVYITETEINGVRMPSITGYGNRPTVNGTEPTCETFIPDFSGDLYGKKVKVLFYKRIKDTKKFASTRDLADAVLAWAQEAKQYLIDMRALTPKDRLHPL